MNLPGKRKFLNKNSLAIGVYLLVSAFLLLMLASRSSFLYPCNDWNDANSYFSVGKALLNGKMPYRDVFDQKGMYLYFLYGLAYLVSHTTFAGVFILEVILGTFTLAGIYHILLLLVKKMTALVLAPMVLAVTISSYSFYWGGSAEEICLPFYIWGLYLALKYFMKKYPYEKMGWKTLLCGGILAGMVANIKFTGLGFFFAWMMMAAFAFLALKDFWGAVKASLIFLGGMAITFIPWIIYFGWNHSLYEWYYGYVYINVFAYSNLQGEGPNLFDRIYTLSKLLYWVIIKNIIYFIFIIPGVIWTILGRNKKWLQRLLIPALCFFLFLGIYVGGSELPYYALPLAVFTVLGFGLLGHLAEKMHGLKTCIGSIVTLAISMGIVWVCSINIPYMSEKKEDIFLYRFRDIVVQEENPTLLNIGCLDAGLYTVCDIVPTCRWFQTQTIHIDDVLVEQERYIREGQITFVLARDSYPEVVWEKYELVDEALWYQGETEFTYYLFRLKDI